MGSHSSVYSWFRGWGEFQAELLECAWDLEQELLEAT